MAKTLTTSGARKPGRAPFLARTGASNSSEQPGAGRATMDARRPEPGNSPSHTHRHDGNIEVKRPPGAPGMEKMEMAHTLLGGDGHMATKASQEEHGKQYPTREEKIRRRITTRGAKMQGAKR